MEHTYKINDYAFVALWESILYSLEKKKNLNGIIEMNVQMFMFIVQRSNTSVDNYWTVKNVYIYVYIYIILRHGILNTPGNSSTFYIEYVIRQR